MTKMDWNNLCFIYTLIQTENGCSCLKEKFFISFHTEVKYKLLKPERTAWNCYFPIVEVLMQHSNSWHPKLLSWCLMRGEAEQLPACCSGTPPYRKATLREHSLSLTISTNDLTLPPVASCWLLLVSGTMLQAGSHRGRTKCIWSVKKKLHEATLPASAHSLKYEMLENNSSFIGLSDSN